MPNPIVTGAMAMCSFGVAPSSLAFLPVTRVTVEGKPVGTVMDVIPGVNVPPFGMCTSLANPQVAAATTAALGVLTPMPCLPVIVGPWKPGAVKTLVTNKPCLTAGSTCNCAYGGVISVTFAGSVKTQAN